ncbi:hypothetical protein CBR_g717 [Chara braunii]|uniref:PX domain-containing protein n=1 Tax=Chara braunii TaxID=69332 RepID=A0A388KC05_CHABU|nr:hypothetical protein CBR_g717 [Chara braunii]|eukprot:GBG67588.1 hypothetical protein CBR_g717 [Chara braunii]
MEEKLVDPPSYADFMFSPYAGEGEVEGLGMMGGGGIEENGFRMDGGSGRVGEMGGGSASSSCAPVAGGAAEGSASRLSSRAGSRSAPGDAAAAAAPLGKDALFIVVSDPMKAVEPGGSLVPGGGTFVTYCVKTRTTIVEFSKQEFSVRRRFRDFVTLADRLAESFRGYFIPPRPDKSVVEGQMMQSKEFIETRRMALEKYLQRLAAHPVIRRSEELRIFLQAEGKLPLMPSTDLASRMLDGAVKFGSEILPRQLFVSEMVSPPLSADVAQPAKGGRDLVRIFKELKQTVANDWGGGRPAIVEEDKDYMDKRENLLKLERHLADTSLQAETLVKSQTEVGVVMGELGLAFIRLANFEEQHAGGVGTTEYQKQHATDARCTGGASVRIGRLNKQAISDTMVQLGLLHEYLAMMQAVHTAMADRSNALLTVQTLMSELAAKKARIEKLEAQSSKVFGGDKSRTRKIADLSRDVALTEAARDVAQQEYDRIKERNRSEVERFTKQRHHDFWSMIEGFVCTQVAYANRAAKIWREMAGQIGGPTPPFEPALSTPSV